MLRTVSVQDAEHHGSEGTSCIALSADGRFCYTAGADGYIRTRDAATLAVIKEEELELSDPVTAIAVLSTAHAAKPELFFGNSQGEVRYAQGLTDELAVRTSPCEVLSLGVLGGERQYLVIGGEEATIRVRDVNNDFRELLSIETASGAGFRGVSCDPKGAYIAALDTENKLYVWKLEDAFGSVTAEVVGSKHFRFDGEERSSVLRMDWAQDGSYLAVPGGEGRDVHLFRRADLDAAADAADSSLRVSEVLSFEREQDEASHRSDVSGVAVSPNGSFIASHDNAGRVVVWDAVRRAPAAAFQLEGDDGPVGQVAWRAGAGHNALFLINGRGEFGTIPDAVPLGDGADAVGPNDADTRPRTAAPAPAAAAAAAAAPRVAEKRLPGLNAAAEDAEEDAEEDTGAEESDADGAEATQVQAAEAAAPRASKKMRRLQKSGDSDEDSDAEEDMLLAEDGAKEKPSLQSFIADEASDDEADAAAPAAEHADDMVVGGEEEDDEEEDEEEAAPAAPEGAPSAAGAVGGAAAGPGGC